MNEFCRFHDPTPAQWCPACEQMKKLARAHQALEIAKMNKHNIDLRGFGGGSPPLNPRCGRLP